MARAKVTMSGQCSMGTGNRTPHHPHVKMGEVKASLGNLYVMSVIQDTMMLQDILVRRVVYWIWGSLPTVSGCTTCGSGKHNGFGR